MLDNIFKEFDASKKDKFWFYRLLNEVRNRKVWLISGDRYRLNQSFADGTYSTDFIRKKFDTVNQPDLGVDFSPIDIIGSRISSIISMIEKQGWEAKADTVDPTARSKRDSDIELLKAEKELEPIRKQMGKALGLNKPLPIASQEDFSSDTSPISKMNLDISNPIDEGIFKDYLQRQVWEISLEVGMQHFLNQNEYNEKLKLVLADLINSGCASQQVVTNSYSGNVQLSYLYPFNVYTFLSKQNDGKDAIGKGWEKEVTVREVIALMGKEITLEDLNQFLSLANTNGNTNYEGIWMDGNRSDPTNGFGFSYPYGVSRERCCEWQKFLGLTCSLGYLEIKSQNSDLYVHRMIDGNLNTVKQPYDYNAPQNIRKVDSIKELKKDSDRHLEYKFYDVTYKGYYIPFTNLVFGFGKLPLAVRYGTNNELTDFSICTQKLKGKSMTEKCIPFVKHIMDCWCKLQFFIGESRPSGELWNIATVREMSKEIIGTNGEEGKLLQTLKVLMQNTNGVYVPQTIDGNPTGGDSMPVKWQERGLDPTSIQLYDIIQRDKNQIIEITGVSDVLLATSSTQSGLGVSQLALQQSINTIYYIQSATQKLFSDVCLNIAQKIQYIVSGDKTVEPYKALVQAIGQRNVDALELLGTTPTWAFSIFIEFGMNSLQREQVDKLTELLIQTKSLTSAQAFMIKDVKNWKLAGALLSYYESKNTQMQQQGQAAQIQAATQMKQQEHAAKMEEIMAENKGKTDVATITGQFAVQVENIKAGVKVETTNTKEVSKHISSDTKQQNDLQKTLLEHQLEKEKAGIEQSHEKTMAAMSKPTKESE